MDDYDRAVKKIGNRFDFVLVATERLRELKREQKIAEEFSTAGRAVRRGQPLHSKAIAEILDGTIGMDYLEKVKAKGRRKRQY